MNLIDGSFRGFPFHIMEHEISGNNFTQEHNYLNSKTNAVENQGSKPREFSLKVIVKGERPEEYHTVRDAFIQKLGQPGSGELIHPYLGSMEVVVKSYTHSNKKEGGVAQFEISLIEVRMSEEDKTDTQYELEKITDQFYIDTEARFKERVDVSGLVNELYRRLENSIVAVLFGIGEIKNSLDYSEYIEKMNSIIELTTNKEYWNNIIQFFDSFLTFKHHTEPVFYLYEKLLNYDREYFTGKELSQEKKYKEQKNLINEAIKYVTIGRVMRLTIEGEVPQSLKNYLLKKIKESQVDPVIPGTHQSLKDIKNIIMDSIHEHEEKKINILTPTPAVVIAWEHGLDIEDILREHKNINKVEGGISV